MKSRSSPPNSSRPATMFSSSKKSNPAPAAKQNPPSILSAGLTVNGDLVSEGEMQIDCVVNGDVTAVRLAVGENARVVGEVMADQVLIRGEVVGRKIGRAHV